MKINQSEELDSQRIVMGIQEESPEVLTDIKEYLAASNGLKASLKVSEAAILAQVTVGDESVSSIDVMRKEAVDAVLVLLGRAKTIAVTSEDIKTENLLNFTFSYLYYTSKEISIQRMLGAMKVMTDRKSQFSTITDPDFKVATDLITAFSGAKDIPEADAKKKKAYGTDALSISLAKGKKFKLLMVNLVVGEYSKSNPELAKKAIADGTPKKHRNHNIGSYAVVDEFTNLELDNPAITEVHISLKKKKKTRIYKLVNKEILTFKTHLLGKCSITVFVPGYLSNVSEIIFKKNAPNDFVFRMFRTPLI